MSQIDFIPDFWRKRRGRRRMIVRSAVLLVAAAGLMAIWQVLFPTQHLEQFERYYESLGRQVEAEERRRDERAARDLETRALRELLALRSELEPPLPTTAIVATLTELMPPAMGLTSLSLVAPPVRPLGAALDPAALGPRNDRRSERNVTRIVVEGLSPDDVSIAKLIGGLDGQPLFAEVELGFSRPVEDLDIFAREFQITTSIPLDREFVVSEPPHGD